MGNAVYTSQLKADFEQLIYREDHKGFFKALEQVDPSSDVWPALQIRGIDFLSRQGLAAKAISSAKKLKTILTDPVLRKQAEIKYLFLDRAVNRNSESQCFEKECLTTLANPDFKELRFFVRGMLLRWRATELMCGLADADNKKPVIKDYLKHIRLCQQNNSYEEAYEFMTELIHFLLSRPYPMTERALQYLFYFRSRSFIAQAPHRMAYIHLRIAGIQLEQCLGEDITNGYEKFYEFAARSFRKVGNSLGEAHIQKSKGLALLKYGKASGRRFLYSAIRSFEAHGHMVAVLSMHQAIVKWLETQGAHSAINGYRIKINTLIEELDLYKVKDRATSADRIWHNNIDLLENTRKVIALIYQPAKAGNENRQKRLINGLIKRIEKKGRTIHLARVLAAKTTSLTARSVSSANRAVQLYSELGYPLEAADLICEYLLSDSLTPARSSLNSDLSEQLKSGVDQIESILSKQPDLESCEALAKSYQLAACSWTVNGFPEKGINMLQKGESVLKKHHLVLSLAFNELYMGCALLDLSSDHNPGSLKAFHHFSEAHKRFRLMHNHEGIWRSQFGMALSQHRQILQTPEKSALLEQECSEHYLRAIQFVHHMTLHHLKTLSRFGDSFVFSTRLQKGADQLYASAIDYFVNVARDPETTESLIDKKQTWALLNRNHPKVKMN